MRYNQGFLAYVQGDDTHAISLLRESLALSRALQYHAESARCLTGLAGTAARCGQPTVAAHLLGAAESLLAMRGNRRDFAARADYQHIITAIRSQLDEAAFVAAWAEGQTMTSEQAIAYALQLSAEDAEQPERAVAASKKSS